MQKIGDRATVHSIGNFSTEDIDTDTTSTTGTTTKTIFVSDTDESAAAEFFNGHLLFTVTIFLDYSEQQSPLKNKI